MACAGFIQSLWEKPIWEGAWPNLDPGDSVCLRTASVEWNVPETYTPHGELFFFLIKKKPATMPGSETFSPFINADIRTSFFTADVLKKCALVALHLIADVTSLVWETNGRWAAHRVQCGRVKAKRCRKTKAFLKVILECVQRCAACHRVAWAR